MRHYGLEQVKHNVVDLPEMMFGGMQASPGTGTVSNDGKPDPKKSNPKSGPDGDSESGVGKPESGDGSTKRKNTLIGLVFFIVIVVIILFATGVFDSKPKNRRGGKRRRNRKASKGRKARRSNRRRR